MAFMEITAGREETSASPPTFVSVTLPMLSWLRVPKPMMVCRATRTPRPAAGVSTTFAALPPSKNISTSRLPVPGSGKGTSVVKVGEGDGVMVPECEPVGEMVQEGVGVGVGVGVGD